MAGRIVSDRGAAVQIDAPAPIAAARWRSTAVSIFVVVQFVVAARGLLCNLRNVLDDEVGLVVARREQAIDRIAVAVHHHAVAGLQHELAARHGEELEAALDGQHLHRVLPQLELAQGVPAGRRVGSEVEARQLVAVIEVQQLLGAPHLDRVAARQPAPAAITQASRNRGAARQPEQYRYAADDDGEVADDAQRLRFDHRAGEGSDHRYQARVAEHDEVGDDLAPQRVTDDFLRLAGGEAGIAERRQGLELGPIPGQAREFERGGADAHHDHRDRDCDHQQYGSHAYLLPGRMRPLAAVTAGLAGIA
ncbi:MAG: hypothetical protein KDC48_16080 [Planctomycetes bacterium]|nr:hypothetical protein [Planctomycetota bacterium]